jgi:hypothetical protein
MPLPEKMRRGRRYHPVATRRRRYFLLAASVFGLNPNPGFDSAPAAVLRKEYTFDDGRDN